MLARQMNFTFFDTDQYIENKYQKRIKDIFSEDGEAHFRKLEEETILLTSHQRNLVVSVGGGAILSAANRLCFQKGEWFFLHTPFSIITQRIMNSEKRPLAQNSEQDLEILYLKRLPLYLMARYKIYSGQHSSLVVSEKILHILKNRQKIK